MAPVPPDIFKDCREENLPSIAVYSAFGATSKTYFVVLRMGDTIYRIPLAEAERLADGIDAALEQCLEAHMQTVPPASPPSSSSIN